MGRLIWADRLKGILIILVVLGHAIQLTLKEACFNNHLWNYIYSFHMATFMAISGYLLYRKKGNRSRISMVYRRLRQLVVPFFMWSIIRILLMKQLSIRTFIDVFLYPDGSFWFLWVLFIIYAVFWVGDWLSEILKIKQEVSVFVIGFILTTLMVFLDIRVLGFQFVAYYYIFFIFGYFLSKYRILVTSNLWVLFSVVIIWAIMGWFWKMHELPSFLRGFPLPQTIMLYGYRVLTGLIAVYAIMGLGPVLLNSEKRTTPVESLGRVSLGVYAAHVLFLPWIISYLFKYSENSFVVISVSFIVALLGSWLCVNLLGKWRITDCLLLGKIRRRKGVRVIA